ncbi:MAG: hypothetical protein MJZ66_08165 [Bacteroidales bacterium]|nr:hypothetical protein [Bacteroidales bacterium]
MKELINNELAQLQKDLENLQSASRMIAQAGEASNGVIAEAKGIHEDFAKNLESLTKLYSEYLEAANKQSSQNQLMVVDHVKKTITDQSAILDKYSQLVETSNNNTQSLYDKAVASQEKSINKLMDDTTKKVDTVKDTYLKQSAETGKLLSSYLELAQSTAELKGKIEAVDFPKRLDNLANSGSAISEEYVKLSKSYQAVKTDYDTLAAKVSDMETSMAKLSDTQRAQDEQLKKILEAASSDKTLRQAKTNSDTISSVKTLAVVIMILLIVAIAGLAYIIVK